jgi:8-amino-7-oxononanoate synthase
MFGSNNYLGLTTHPEVLAAAHGAIDRFGTATTGSRVANGTLVLHRELEGEFARRFRKRSAIVFTTGYQANLSMITALCGPGDTLLIDADSHASIYDAARLSGAQLLWFRHNSVENLERKLTRLPRRVKNRLVVVEGLYSIRGDVAPLREIARACRAHDAYLMVDEAHSFGVFGERGLGCSEAAGVLGEVDFVVGTFSKALGGVGGFAVSDHPELRYLHFAARPYVFTASGSPANIAGVLAALRVLEREPERRSRLWANVRRMRAGLERNGLSIGGVESPIIPILIGDITATVFGWQALLQAGLYVNVVLPPGCPLDRCQLRASCTSAHTDEQIDRALAILGDVATRFGFARSVAISG